MNWLLLTVSAASAAYSITGVFKPGLELSVNDSTAWNGHLYTRLMDDLRFGPFKADMAISVNPTFGDPALEGPEDGYSQFRITDIEPRTLPSDWEGNEHFSLLTNIDRLSLQMRPAGLRITLGRQAIFWGISESVSPTDFIAPFPYGTIDTDYRTGVDAVRVVCPAGIMSEVEGGFAAGNSGESEKNGYWLRTRLFVAGTDMSFIAADFNNNLLAGGSLNMALGGALGRVESAGTSPDSGDTYWRLTAGLERSFRNSTVYAFAEYHYNSPGGSEYEEYSYLIDTPAYNRGGVYLLAKHYLAAGLTIMATPLLTLNGNTLVNLNDRSSQLMATAEYSLSDNVSLNCGTGTGFGSVETEFGNLPGVVHAFLSLYF